MASRASRWACSARSAASASARRARSRSVTTSWRLDRTTIPQLSTSRTSSAPTTVDARNEVAGSGRRYGCTGATASASTPTAATGLNGRCTATLNSATSRAPAATGSTTETSVRVTARPTGHRRRVHRAQQAAAPTSESMKTTPSGVVRSASMAPAAAAPIAAAQRNAVMSTTQSRTVRRALRPWSPGSSGSAIAEGSSQGYSVRVISTKLLRWRAGTGRTGAGGHRSRRTGDFGSTGSET